MHWRQEAVRLSTCASVHASIMSPFLNLYISRMNEGLLISTFIHHKGRHTRENIKKRKNETDRQTDRQTETDRRLTSTPRTRVINTTQLSIFYTQWNWSPGPCDNDDIEKVTESKRSMRTPQNKLNSVWNTERIWTKTYTNISYSLAMNWLRFSRSWIQKVKAKVRSRSKSRSRSEKLVCLYCRHTSWQCAINFDLVIHVLTSCGRLSHNNFNITIFFRIALNAMQSWRS